MPILEACFDNQARLREGDGGDPVIRVQQALVDLGADLGPTGADGTYGPKTAAAVRKFKADENLGSEQFGDVGPGTIGRLDELFAQDKPATPGGSKMDVGDTDDAVEEPSSCPSPLDLESEIGAGGTTESAGTTQALTDTVTAPAVDAAGPTPVGATNLDSAVRDFANRLDVPIVGPDDPGNVSAGGQFLFSSKVQVGLDDTPPPPRAWHTWCRWPRTAGCSSSTRPRAATGWPGPPRGYGRVVDPAASRPPVSRSWRTWWPGR